MTVPKLEMPVAPERSTFGRAM